jgi:hypothetical protein
MISDNEFMIGMVFSQIDTLEQSLKGNGTSEVTPHANVNGRNLSDALRRLQVTIDEFLAEKF